jgi:hypothetical protein
MFAKSRAHAGLLTLATALVVAAGCTGPATEFATKLQASATEKCNEGNEAACHTIVQQISDTKVLIENTAPIETQTPACNAGKQDACQQMAVLHSELSAWCQSGNNRACGAVNIGPWPTKWDEPALIDAAKLSCLSGQFKPESHTCQALQMM